MPNNQQIKQQVITFEDIYACLDYAVSLAEEQITPILRFLFVGPAMCTRWVSLPTQSKAEPLKHLGMPPTLKKMGLCKKAHLI
jgi:hypothetical protein